ncbi:MULTISPECIES: 2-oxo-4-hydroxy-4-carboxy-5-ureidoimidazoline decarboxylase [Methylobacterium]|jgi:2-oxo-4-hydroxy-4-carboxy-5-ureidoimidazoline decarboxylase|uniref:2-oxo-4-hydroxy-4-carboxy-5-ureidoimidazoline decarboxylase n=1 Tax=Methylobacterium hispanicum TaxID=270350 RepID=A0AAV4ZY46_9HYPH|nr:MULTISPECIES: 2-oxo-4-hydroxy-4-carboxy-5-ureidoimidazoline decarboxylase [Methylobacterium]GJD92549.1 Uric acid degradation bifunctional protein [Methylobacterium hispanicum]
MISLSRLNAVDRSTFVSLLGEIYEHSPWVAEAAFTRRPFATRDELRDAMSAVVAQADPERQLALLRAHPELAGRAAIRGELTTHSADEQEASGLLNGSSEELRRIQDLNRAYGETFGFPFVIAVKGMDRSAIIAALERRLGNPPDEERLEALRQVSRIAAFRLEAAVGS